MAKSLSSMMCWQTVRVYLEHEKNAMFDHVCHVSWRLDILDLENGTVGQTISCSHNVVPRCPRLLGRKCHMQFQHCFRPGFRSSFKHLEEHQELPRMTIGTTGLLKLVCSSIFSVCLHFHQCYLFVSIFSHVFLHWFLSSSTFWNCFQFHPPYPSC